TMRRRTRKGIVLASRNTPAAECRRRKKSIEDRAPELLRRRDQSPKERRPMNTPFTRTRIATAVAGVAFAFGAGQALGTGFQINEQSASSLGNAFAAGAAFTDDASAMWWNPAALSKFNRAQVAGVFNVITPSIKFKNDGSLPAANQPLGGTGGDAGGYNYPPAAYVAIPINPQWVFGVGVNVPFGLKTEYDDGWLGRYQG